MIITFFQHKTFSRTGFENEIEFFGAKLAAFLKVKIPSKIPNF